MLPTDTTADPSLHTLSFGCPDILSVECLSSLQFDRWRHLSGEYKIKYAGKGDRIAFSLDSPKKVGIYLSTYLLTLGLPNLESIHRCSRLPSPAVHPSVAFCKYDRHPFQ